MQTVIKITPPGGQQQTIKAFETCQTNLSTTDKAGSFSLGLPAFDSSLIDAFPVGSDVQITQDGNVFRGWVVKPPKTLNSILRTVNLQGSTYTSRTQKIIVTESYTNAVISDIVIDLFKKYVPWANAELPVRSDTVFSRPSVAYNTDGSQVVTNIPRYQTGKFGQSILVEEGTTNLLTANQAHPTSGTTGFSRWSNSGAPIISQDNSQGWVGAGSLKCVLAGGTFPISGGVYIPLSGLTPSTTYTFQCRAKLGASSVCLFEILAEGVTVISTTEPIITTSCWSTYTCTFTTGVAQTTCNVHFYLNNDANGSYFWIDGLQLESKPYPTSFIGGGSSRSAESLTLPLTGIFDTAKFSFECWFNRNTSDATGNHVFLKIYANATNQIVVRTVAPNNYLNLTVYSGSSVYDFISTFVPQPNTWYYLAVTFDGNVAKLYVNGVMLGSVTYVKPIGVSTVNPLGLNESSGAHSDSLIEDVRISNIDRSSSEILDSYNSSLPLAVDGYTTYKLNFDGGLTAQTGGKVSPSTKLITIRFGDLYLWDAMEQLCQISGYDWFIDENLSVNFFDGNLRINSTVLSQANNNYKRGSASFAPDASKLANRLWVKGGKATSAPYTQSITVSTTPIPIFYTPSVITGADVTVTIGGVAKTVGIQNIDKAGTKDFLLNVDEKLLIPDLCTSGTGTIIYMYVYPIKLFLEDLPSQVKYGLFEDVYNVDTDDKTLAKEMGLQYLAKYSDPVISGSIEPMQGVYKPGELILIQIPDLNVDEYLQILEVSYESIKGMGLVNRVLTLQSRERDAVSILKDMHNRLMKLEKSVYNDTDGPVEKYVAFSDTIVTPVFVDDGLTWFLHQYHICGQTICGPGVIL